MGELELYVTAAALGRKLNRDFVDLFAALEQLHLEGFALAALTGDRDGHRRIPADNRATRGVDHVHAHVGLVIGQTGLFQLRDIEGRRPTHLGPSVALLTRVDRIRQHQHARQLLTAQTLEKPVETQVEVRGLPFRFKRVELFKADRRVEVRVEGIDLEQAR